MSIADSSRQGWLDCQSQRDLVESRNRWRSTTFVTGSLAVILAGVAIGNAEMVERANERTVEAFGIAVKAIDIANTAVDQRNDAIALARNSLGIERGVAFIHQQESDTLCLDLDGGITVCIRRNP